CRCARSSALECGAERAADALLPAGDARVPGRADAPRAAIGRRGKSQERVCGLADAAASNRAGHAHGTRRNLRRSAPTAAAGTPASLAAWLAAGTHPAFVGAYPARRGARGCGAAILEEVASDEWREHAQPRSWRSAST